MEEKLYVLKNAGIINQEIYDYVLLAKQYLQTNQIVQEAQAAEVFLTHLAMAAARQVNGEAVQALDAFMQEEIIANKNYAQAQTIWQAIAALAPVAFAETELDYFYLHLCNLLNER